MFDQIFPQSFFPTKGCAAPLKAFAGPHRDSLLSAAGLLGGRRGTRLAIEALEGLESEEILSKRTQARFEALLELLSLEHVHDEDREESSRFAAIDPCDPVVEEICALTDGLRDAIERATTDHRPASRVVAA